MGNKSEKSEWTKFIQNVICILIGAIIAFSATSLKEYSEKRRYRKEAAKIIYVDVQNKLLSMLNTLNNHPYEKLIEDGHDMIVRCKYDLSAFDAYISKIALFQSKEPALIMGFYGNIKILNNILDIQYDPSLPLTKKDSVHWLKNYYITIYKTVRKGKTLMKTLRDNYEAESLKGVQKKLDDLEQKILLRNPELKEKLSIIDSINS
jgi:hypothetical protein